MGHGVAWCLTTVWCCGQAQSDVASFGWVTTLVLRYKVMSHIRTRVTKTNGLTVPYSTKYPTTIIAICC